MRWSASAPPTKSFDDGWFDRLAGVAISAQNADHPVRLEVGALDTGDVVDAVQTQLGLHFLAGHEFSAHQTAIELAVLYQGRGGRALTVRATRGKRYASASTQTLQNKIVLTRIRRRQARSPHRAARGGLQLLRRVRPATHR